MDTVTKVIIGALIAVFSACAVICGVWVNMEIALVFTGLATSGMTALAGISYGARLSGGELIQASAATIDIPAAPQPPA